ncbi:Ornithine decarboxylase [Lemmus lemmus]
MNSFKKEEFDCHILDEGFTAKDILDQKINEVSSSDDKDAFYVADLGDILKKHLRWLKALPRVTPFYAVKSNDSRAIVNTLAARIIYANPCKQVSQIKYAASSGVQMMTFDSEIELMKVARAHPKAKLVLRIATDDSKAVCRLSVKFGATLKTSRLLLERAKELNIDVIGVSMYLLDIGGGFPGSEDTKLKFEEITSVINPALDKYFPPDSGVRVIAEPGRYYVASAFTLAEQTGSDDEDESNEQTFMYYVNDGVYGSFNCILYDHAHVKALLPKRPKPDEKYYSSSIWGPTCDGLDRIVERCNGCIHCCCCVYFQRVPEAFYLLCNVEANVATHEADPEPWLPTRSGGAGYWHSAHVLCPGERDGPSPSSLCFH